MSGDTRIMSVCNHTWRAATHEGYDLCCACGSFKSQIAPPPEELYTPDYWTPENGHSTQEEQIWNCEEYLNEKGVSKNDFILSQIVVPEKVSVMEVGASPGALFKRLTKKFLTAYAVDPIPIDGGVPNNAMQICTFFPEGTSRIGTGQFDLIIASDVFEHSHKPWPFLAECARLLKLYGQLIIMAPIVGLEGAEMPERMFNPDEHVWLHSADNLTALLGQAGFHTMTYDRWLPGHETVSAIRGEAPIAGLREARSV